MAKDYYTILGVPHNASLDEIKKAYRRLSKELHPDKKKGDKQAEDQYKDVNEAYEVLSDPKKKQMYDQFGTADGSSTGFGGFDFSGFSGFGGGGLNDLGDLFESFFGGNAKARTRGQETRGEDLEVRITVNLADVVRDQTKEIALQKMVACEECSGSGTEKGSAMRTCSECSGTGQVTRTRQSFFGAMQQSFLCPTCNGSGEVPEKPCKKCSAEGRVTARATVSIMVPAGIRDGQTLRVQGQGNAGRRGGTSGDLYVHLQVRPDARFERDGDDLRSSVTLHVLDAIVGATIPLQTIHGPVDLVIPEGTLPDQQLRVKGKGMPVLNTSRHGDHYVTVNVEIPKKLSRQEKQLLEEWKKLRA